MQNSGLDARPLILALTVLVAAVPVRAGFEMASGHYVGNGLDGRGITGLGFSPDVVFVKGNNITATIAKTSTMAGDLSKELGSSLPASANLVESLDADGFTVGNDWRVNTTGLDYYWIAFRGAAGEMSVGSFLGDGTDDRAVTGLGLEPTYMIVLAEGSEMAMHRFASEASGLSKEFRRADEMLDRIQDFLPDGFELGTNAAVNADGAAYHYVAWAATAGKIGSGAYAGDSTDDRSVSGLGFEPEYVLLTDRNAVAPPVHRMSSLPGDNTLHVDPGGSFTNGVQSFLGDGFQIGSDQRVNSWKTDYLWVAFRADALPDPADLALAKSVDDPAPDEGGSIEYTIVVTNLGPGEATGVTIADALPAGITFGSSAATRGAYDDVTGLWSLGTVAAATSDTLTLAAVVNSGTAGTTIENTASVFASDQSDPNAANDSASVSLTVTSVDLELAKTAGNSAPNEGEGFSYEITVTNLGPSAASGIEVTDALPSGVSFVSSTATSGSYDDATGLWTLGALGGGASATLTISVTVDAGTAGTTIENTALVSGLDQVDTNPANDAAGATITVPSSDLAIAKSVDDPAPAEADTIHYAIVLENLGPDDASGVAVTDALPTGVAFVSSSATRGAYDEGTGLWSLGTVAAATSDTLTLAAVVNSGTAGTTIENTASVFASDQSDPNAANDSDGASITVEQLADLEIAKSVDNAAPNEGQSLTYSVVVTNHGPGVASGVEVTDLLPAGVTFVTSVPSKGGYDDQTGIWSVGTLSSSGSAVLILGATVEAGTGGTTIVNTAAVTASDLPDDNPANDVDSASVSVPLVDLAVTKNVDQAVAEEGETVTFTITLENAGPDGATGVELTDALPAGLTFVASATTRGAYDEPTGIWSVDTVGVAASDTLVITATVDAGTSGQTLENVVAISARDQADADGSNDSDVASVSVEAVDVSIAVSVDQSTPNEADTIQYTLLVSNAGPSTAAPVEVTAPLPAKLQFVSATTTQGAYDEVTGIWSLGALASSASDTLTVTATVGADAGGSTIVYSATVTDVSPSDSNPANDTDSAESSVPLVPGEVQVTSGAGNDQRPSWSPDGHQFAFDSNRAGNQDVWTIPAIGGTARQVTNDLDLDQHPDWSPDQSQLAYSSRSGSTPNIYVVPAAGGLPVLLNDDVSTTDRFPDFSPDGSLIAYTKGEDIYVVPATGGTPLQITTDPGIDVHPTWSPDGSKIAFLSNRSGNNDIWVIPVGGGPATQLTTDPANDGAPDWSPDGGRIAFQSNRMGNQDVWTIPATGGSPTRITTNTASDVQPEWSPSGNKIAFSRNGDLWIVTLEPSTDLEISKTVSNPIPFEGETIAYDVVISNRGAFAALDVTVTDLLPAGVTFQSGTTTAGDYDETTGIWNVTNIEPASSDTLTIVASVDAGTGSSTIVNVASMTSSDPTDHNDSNDTDSAEIQVQIVVGVDTGGFVPDRFELGAARPNPFGTSTTFRFDVPVTGRVGVSVVDVTGRLVTVLTDGEREPGRHDVVWDGSDRFGRAVAPGIYFVRMESGGFAATRKVVRLR